MPDFAVSTSFTAQDRVTKSFSRMSKGATKFGRSASAAFQKASRSGSKFGAITKGILAAGAVQRGLGMIQMGLTSVTGGFIEFDDAVTGATVRFKDIGPAAKNFQQQMDAVKKSARDAGATTEFTAAQSAKALDFLARAGFTSAEAMGSLRSMINLATGTGEDFALVADFSSDLLGAFGLAVKDTGQKIKNLNRLNDVLVKTANSANVTVEDMFETMKIGAPIVVKFGASLEDVAAMTAIMGNAGIKGSQGATAIKNVFTRLAAPTKDVTKALGALGLTQQDLINKQGKLKNITDIMQLIGDRLKDVAQPKQLGILKGLFGAFALAGGANLVSAIGDIKEFKTMLQGAAGTSQKTADIMRKSLGNQLKALGSAATEFAFKFFAAFDRIGKGAITRIIKAIRGFDVEPMIFALATVGRAALSLGREVAKAFGFLKPGDGVGQSIRNVALAMAQIMEAVKPLIPILPVVIAGMIAYSTALKVQALLTGVAAIQAMAGATGILNAVMAANPIGAVILAVTALVAAGILLYKNWDQVSAGMKQIFDDINTGANWAAEQAAIGIQKALGFIGRAFTATGKLLFKMFIDPVIFGFTAAAKAVLKFGSFLGRFAGFDISGLGDMIKDLEAVRQEIIKNQAAPIFPDTPTAVQAASAAQAPTAVQAASAAQAPTATSAVQAAQAPTAVQAVQAAQAPTAVQAASAAQAPTATQAVQAAQAPTATQAVQAAQAPTAPATPAAPVAPNRTEVEAKQSVNLTGKIQVAGAPEGSTGEVKTNGRRNNNFNMEILGANP